MRDVWLEVQVAQAKRAEREVQARLVARLLDLSRQGLDLGADARYRRLSFVLEILRKDLRNAAADLLQRRGKRLDGTPVPEDWLPSSRIAVIREPWSDWSSST
jgi:hypothetical protein